MLDCCLYVYSIRSPRVMKRTFTQFDEFIPPVVWEHFPEQRAALDRISGLEEDMQRVWARKRRTSLAVNSEPAALTKVMRIFVKSQFVHQAQKELCYHLVTIEGRMLEIALSELHHFGYFFDSIKLAIDKRSGSSSQLSTIEWDVTKHPEGRQADCFRFKVFHDKACFVKFYLTRSSDVQPRYDLSPALRDMLPNMRWDPTEEDIFLAIWSYIMDKGLVDNRSRSLVKTDDALKQVLGGVEVIPVPVLRHKILEQCSPARAVVVEYTLSNKVSDPAANAPARFSRAAFIEAGGRTFDLDVDILDPISYEIVAEIKRSADLERASDAALAKLVPTISYLSRKIMREALNVLPVSIDETALDPLGIGESSFAMSDVLHSVANREEVVFKDGQTSDTAGDGDGAPGFPRVSAETGVRLPSAIHNYRGYIDVGNDALFADIEKVRPRSPINIRDPAVSKRVNNQNQRDSVSWVRVAVKALLPEAMEVEPLPSCNADSSDFDAAESFSLRIKTEAP